MMKRKMKYVLYDIKDALEGVSWFLLCLAVIPIGVFLAVIIAVAAVRLFEFFI